MADLNAPLEAVEDLVGHLALDLYACPEVAKDLFLAHGDAHSLWDGLLVLQVGLSVQILRLYVATALGSGRVNQYDISRDLLVLEDFHYPAHPHLLPEHLRKHRRFLLCILSIV